MMTRCIAVLGLILIFWCHQSHHQIFLFINTSPVGLASEEFIPHNDPVPPIPDSDVGKAPETEGNTGKEEGIQRSQNVKSDDSMTTDKSNSVVEETGLPQPEVNDEPLSHSMKGESGNLIGNVEQGSSFSNKPTESQHVVSDSQESISLTSTPSPPDSSFQSSAAGQETEKEQGERIENESDLKKTVTEDGINEEGTKNGFASGEGAYSVNRTNESTETDSTTATKSEPPPPVVVPPAAPPTPQKDEEPIPSFMEWTQLQQQKLHESNLAHQAAVTASAQANAQNGYKSQHATHSQSNKSSSTGNQANSAKASKESNAKNFASPDCGAKVIQSNPESQNANGVLSSSHDEYMLNKCGIPIWFIVELCEPLKIEKVSLGNLELFSSSPKDIEIGISDRFPTREWTKLGPFTLPDTRAIHSINFPATNASTFGKFIKVNILSHYGTEHFCPLSLVKVNGISEYEVLESENIHPEDIDETDKEESALYEEPVVDQTQQQSASQDGNAADKSVFGSAKDVVINIVKKAAEVLVKSDKRKDALHPNMQDPSVRSNCRSLLQCLPNYEIQFPERVLTLLACNFSNLLPFLSKNSPWCGWDYCHALFSRHSIGLPWQPEGFYASLFGGPSVLHALCNYHRPIIKETCDTLPSQNISTSAKADAGALPEGYVNESVKIPSVPSSVTDTMNEVKEPVKVKESQSEDTKPEGIQAGTIPESTGSTKSPPTEPEVPAQSSEESPSSQQANNGESIKVTQQPPSQAQNGQQGSTEDGQTHAPPQQQQSNINGQQQQQQQHTHQQPPPQPPVSVQQQQQKESVFVRLSNRIKTLERNQTLTASYLEELSRRFKKQNEENHHTNEETKIFMNESKLKFKLMEDAYKFELRSLRRNTEEIRERLFNVQLQRSLLIILCLLQFIGIISVCVWVRRKFRYLESQLVVPIPPAEPRRARLSLTQSVVPLAITSPSSSVASSRSARIDNNSPQHSSLLAGRKRVNSEASIGSSLNSIDKSKKIKKKKKKLPEIKPVNIKASGPVSAPIDYSGSGKEGFKFKYPGAPVSSSSAYEISSCVSSNFKENIKPEEGTEMDSSLLRYKNSSLPSTPPASTTASNGNTSSGGTTILSTQVDSPFSMISSTSTNFFVDSAVSTSSRFALLASPGPGMTGKSSSLKRSGSLTSLDSSSTSSYSYGVKTGSNNVMNGHGDSQSQGSNGSSGKKRKNKGLKALMPKIFDR